MKVGQFESTPCPKCGQWLTINNVTCMHCMREEHEANTESRTREAEQIVLALANTGMVLRDGSANVVPLELVQRARRWRDGAK